MAPTAISRACATRRPSGCETADTGHERRRTRSRSIRGPAGRSAATCARSPDAKTAITMTAASPARCPPGQYFMMGDNRDNSDDSRYWGFVPDDHIRGQGVLHLVQLGRYQQLGVQAHRQRHPLMGGKMSTAHAAGADCRCSDSCSSAVVVVAVVMIGFRMLPAYIEYFSVQKALAKVAARMQPRTISLTKFRRDFDRRPSADYIESVRRQRHRGHQGRQRSSSRRRRGRASCTWSAT